MVVLFHYINLGGPRAGKVGISREASASAAISRKNFANKKIRSAHPLFGRADRTAAANHVGRHWTIGRQRAMVKS